MININGRNYFGIIYKIENVVNGKVFIGATTEGFKKEYPIEGNSLIERVYNSNKALKRNSILNGDIEKYGIKAFRVEEVYDVADNDYALQELTKHHINYCNSSIYGYNNL